MSASLFDGVSSEVLQDAVWGARQVSGRRGKPRWVAHVAGRTFGEFATMSKAMEAARAAQLKELTARGFYRVDEFGDLV